MTILARCHNPIAAGRADQFQGTRTIRDGNDYHRAQHTAVPRRGNRGPRFLFRRAGKLRIAFKFTGVHKMYEKRCIAFVDILGFGALVEESSQREEIQKSIHDALMTLHPQKVTHQAYSRLCIEMCHSEEELKRAAEESESYNKIILTAHPVLVTFFSDSIVISSASEDPAASALVIDLVVRLAIRLWQDHGLLIRGGVTVGNLCHIVDGPLFGPAMNRAYHLESKEAKNPRILVDKEYFCCLYAFQHRDFIRHLVSTEHGSFYFSLAGAFKYTLNTNREFDPDNRNIFDGYAGAIGKLSRIMDNLNKDEIKSKYIWLIEDFENSYNLRP